MFNHGRLASVLRMSPLSRCVCAITMSAISISTSAEVLTVNSSQEAMSERAGMPFIEEGDLSNVTAFGISEDIAYLQNIANQTGPDDDVAATALMAIFEIAVPGFGLLSDYTVSGVEYDDPSGDKSIINNDGTITVVIPDRIGEILFNNFTFGDDENSSPLGVLSFRDIKLIPGSRIILRPVN